MMPMLLGEPFSPTLDPSREQKPSWPAHQFEPQPLSQIHQEFQMARIAHLNVVMQLQQIPALNQAMSNPSSCSSPQSDVSSVLVSRECHIDSSMSDEDECYQAEYDDDDDDDASFDEYHDDNDDAEEQECLQRMLELVSANDVALNQLTQRLHGLHSRLMNLEHFVDQSAVSQTPGLSYESATSVMSSSSMMREHTPQNDNGTMMPTHDDWRANEHMKFRPHCHCSHGC